MGLSENLRARRKALKLTLEDVAAEVGTSKQTIQRYESGQIANIPQEKIEKLADPAYPCLISTPFSAPAWFIGRERESRILNDWCRDETKQTLFISGMGGIGKSTFVRRVLSANRQLWDSIVFL